MTDLGLYKTYFSKTFRCHYDPANRVALARGPLPAMTTAHTISAEDEKEAAVKLAKEIGIGVFAKSSRMAPASAPQAAAV